MPFQPGDTVGPYTIIEQLGQGGMATVFKAYHAALDRNVAIKALHPAFLQDPQFLQRFQREARVVAKLDHPNIVPVFDYADHKGQTYLVMKYIEGETLKAALDRGWPSKQEILHIVKSVGNALTYAHDQGVLHRDVKPSNILLTQDEGVFLADFGLARMAEAGQSTMSGDQLLGTPHYISPEQARGEKDLDEGTDVYSLAIVLYQLSVGRVPFSSDTPFSIIHDHIYSPLPLPRSLNKNIPEGLEQVLLKALSKDRADRFANVAELTAAFESAITGKSPWEPGQVVESPAIPVVAFETEADSVPVSAEAQSVVQVQRKRWPWVVGGLAFAFVCLLTFAVGMRNSVEGSENVNSTLEDQPLEADLGGPIAAAQEIVGQRPDDPMAHFELAEALAESGLNQNAVQEYAKAAELFLGQHQYAGAAEAIINGMALSDQGPQDDFRASNALSQALFLGAEQGGMLPAIDAVAELAPDWPPLQALRARSLLFMGEHEQATGLLEDVLARSPKDLFANAVMVEVAIEAGDMNRAQRLTERLLERDQIPRWLQEHLRALSSEP